MSSPRMITLTLKADDGSLKERIDRLFGCFRRLRKSPLWRSSVLGGVAVFEVTRGANGAHWHVHLHALVDGSFIDQRALSDLWNEITDGSRIVDIRAIYNRADAARYIAKYAAKGANLRDWADEPLVEYIRSIHRRRMVTTFGRVYAPSIDADADSVHDATDVPMISVGKFAAMLASGLAEAWEVRRLLMVQGGTIARMLAVYPSEAEPVQTRELTETERYAMAAAWAVCFSVSLIGRDVRIATPGARIDEQLRLWDAEGRPVGPDDHGEL